LRMAGAAGGATQESEIRVIDSVDELHACEELQRHAWGFSGDLDVVPITQMVAALHSGGLVLGAFDPCGRLLGFCYGFVGRESSGELFHHSHMTAVVESARASGVGARLKWAQRRAVLAQGIDRIVWTYDPLESLNGYFNFTKLGVVARRYWRNLYGETSSELHRGSPTDRLRADWHLSSSRVRERARGRPGPEVELARGWRQMTAVLVAQGDSVLPGEPVLDAADEHLACQIPSSIQTLKQADPEAALAWRMATRAVFENYLSAGYVVRECVRTPAPDRRTLYVLERERSQESDG